MPYSFLHEYCYQLYCPPSNPLNLTSGTFCPSFGNMDCSEASFTCFSDATFLSAVSINESMWRKYVAMARCSKSAFGSLFSAEYLAEVLE